MNPDTPFRQQPLTEFKVNQFSPNERPFRVVRMQKVKEMTGLAHSTLFAKYDPSSPCFDPTFPKRVRLGLRSVGWIESEVMDWVQNSRVH